MKESIRKSGQDFTARRMVADYVRMYYAPGLAGSNRRDDAPTG
jgi:hypothetical protein